MCMYVHRITRNVTQAFYTGIIQAIILSSYNKLYDRVMQLLIQLLIQLLYRHLTESQYRILLNFRLVICTALYTVLYRNYAHSLYSLLYSIIIQCYTAFYTVELYRSTALSIQIHHPDYTDHIIQALHSIWTGNIQTSCRIIIQDSIEF